MNSISCGFIVFKQKQFLCKATPLSQNTQFINFGTELGSQNIIRLNYSILN